MSTGKKSATGETEIIVLTEGSWQRKQADAKAKGWQDLKTSGKDNGSFDVEILCPREVRDVESLPLAAAIVEHDWKYTRKIRLAALGRQIISEAYFLGTLSDDLPRAVAKAIQGEDLAEEKREAVDLAEQRTVSDVQVALQKSDLNDLYTQFEKKVGGPKKVLGEMKNLAGSDKTKLKPYLIHGNMVDTPIPYAVRNSIYHHNPSNTWNSSDLATAIEILREWI